MFRIGSIQVTTDSTLDGRSRHRGARGGTTRRQDCCGFARSTSHRTSAAEAAAVANRRLRQSSRRLDDDALSAAGYEAEREDPKRASSLAHLCRPSTRSRVLQERTSVGRRQRASGSVDRRLWNGPQEGTSLSHLLQCVRQGMEGEASRQIGRGISVTSSTEGNGRGSSVQGTSSHVDR